MDQLFGLFFHIFAVAVSFFLAVIVPYWNFILAVFVAGKLRAARHSTEYLVFIGPLIIIATITVVRALQLFFAYANLSPDFSTQEFFSVVVVGAIYGVISKTFITLPVYFLALGAFMWMGRGR